MENNKRRMPTGDGIMNDKMFNDLIYAYLQSVSYRNPSKEDRYVWKKDFNKTEISKKLNIGYKTFCRNIKYMLDNNFIIEKEDRYELPKVSQWNAYMPINTLNCLINTNNKKLIKVYSYLYQLKNTMKSKAYFTKGNLLIRMGYKINNKNGEIEPSKQPKDWDCINMILDILENDIKLITTKEVYIYDGVHSSSKILYDIKDKEEIIEKNDDRLSDDYKDFIKSIYRRDSFECKICGDKNNLVSHHINGYNWYKEGRLEPLNNITLCSKCHEEFHNIYGRGDNTWEQFKEYLIFLKNEYSNNYIIDNTIKDVEKRMKILQIRTKNK